MAADRFVRDATDDFFELTQAQAYFQRHQALNGLELVPDAHRLCLMNLMLHGIEGNVESGDTLSPDGEGLPKADLVLTNPPFGTKKGGGRPTRSDFSIMAETSNKQLAFVEHVVRALKPGGRAAAIVPDNVLFEGSTGQRLRTWLMDLCDLHTILRLPTGIFYSPGVQTNVLFFTRGQTDRANTRTVWVYDLRVDMPAFGKTTPLKREHFQAFERAFGQDPYGKASRTDEGATGRFRCYTRKQIEDRNDNLDIVWLRDTAGDPEVRLVEPDDIAAAVIVHLKQALEEIEAVSEELDNDSPLEKIEVPDVELPATWTRVCLKDVAEATSGYGFPKDIQGKTAGDYPFAKVRDISWAVLQADGNLRKADNYVDEHDLPSLRARPVSEGSTVFAKIGEALRLNRRAIVLQPTILDNNCMAITPDERLIDRFYLFWFMQTVDLAPFSVATTVPSVRRGDVESIEAPLPPIDEQRRIVALVDTLIERTRSARTELERVLFLENGGARDSRLLRNLEKAVLRRAFSGQLIPQDPKDEPAQVLLDRIRAECGAAPARRGRGRRKAA